MTSCMEREEGTGRQRIPSAPQEDRLFNAED